MFRNRREAGRRLATKLKSLNLTNPYIFALAKNGVPVGYEIAKTFNSPLDVVVIKRLRVPYKPSISFGAIGPGNLEIIDEESIKFFKLSDSEIQFIKAKAAEELNARIGEYMTDTNFPDIRSRDVIFVTDGIDTGIATQTAVCFLKSFKPATITVASPICNRHALQRLKPHADYLICLGTPENFLAVENYYKQASVPSDRKVKEFLRK